MGTTGASVDMGAAPPPAPDNTADSPAPDSPAPHAPPAMDPNPEVPVDTEKPHLAAPSGALRLTRSELSNALSDLLREGTDAPQRYLAEEEFSPYDNELARQTVSPALVDGLAILAEEVAERATENEIVRHELLPCSPQAANDTACFDETVGALVRRFFRRPGTPQDIARYRSLLEFAAEQDDFYVAVRLLLAALIQDPQFLYRLERGEAPTSGSHVTLTNHEIATRLAMLLWGSVPDEALLSLADAGALTDTRARREAAERMLADTRARTQLNRFHAMWLGYRAIPHDAALNAAFQMETEKLIEHVVFDEPQNYLNLFSSDRTYLTSSLAEHYGLPNPAGEEGWVNYPTESGRAGILSHGSVLSGFSKFSDTSPTQRGIFVRTRLLCQTVPSPPATVNVDQPPGEDATGACKAERYRAHREQSGCAECHSLFEPIGLGLENFDIAGRYREHDDGRPDCLIQEPGALPGYGEFNDPKTLSKLLLDNELITSCFIQQYLSFAFGEGEQPSQTSRALASTLSESFIDSGYSFNEWLLGWIASDDFTRIVQEQP